MVKFTWVEIINGIFKAHRDRDKVALKFWQDMWDDTEVEAIYADTFDAMNV